MKLFWIAGLMCSLVPAWGQDEKDHPPHMKAINANMKILKASMETKSAVDATEAARKVEAAFSETRKYWAAKGTADALEWTDSAINGAKLTQAGLAEGRWEKMGDGVSKLGGTCKQCHNVHRERLGDGTYRIK